MKVAFLTGSLSRKAGGFLPILQRLSNELSDKDCDVTAFGIEDADLDTDRAGWERTELRPFRPFGPSRLAWSRAMEPALNECGPDLLHLHGLWMGVSAVCHRWHHRSGRPYVISAQGMLESWAVSHNRLRKRVAGWMYENRNLRDAACLHALSKHEVEDYRRYGLRNPVAIIPNGVELPGESDVDQTPPWQAFAPNSDGRVLLFLGRLHAKKGLVELLEGWKLAGAGRGQWRFVIAGWDDAGHQAVIEQRIRRLGLEREVQVVGPQFGPAKSACFAKADAFILASHSEGLPVAVLEAWAHRLPALITPACNLPCGYERNAAMRIEPNAESIAAGLTSLFEISDASRRQMGENGRALVAERKYNASVKQSFRIERRS